MMDFKKYSKEFADSMESATDEIELSINLILNKYGLSGNNLSALQMLLAKEILKESEDMGGGLVGDITRDFVITVRYSVNDSAGELSVYGSTLVLIAPFVPNRKEYLQFLLMTFLHVQTFLRRGIPLQNEEQHDDFLN